MASRTLRYALLPLSDLPILGSLFSGSHSRLLAANTRTALLPHHDVVMHSAGRSQKTCGFVAHLDVFGLRVSLLSLGSVVDVDLLDLLG